MANRYDDILYAGNPFSQTHPDRLGTIARLFGMRPAAVERCRVLELGCGDGGNLIPMAYTLRGSEFVGVDLGARGIAIGQEMVDALGLGNVRLQCLDITEAADLGKFDYILAHGVYSWVPPAVQDRMLAICRENLNPQGVAYISYAAYPGAHIRAMIAEILQYHARRFEEPAQQIEQAHAILGFLATARPVRDVYSALLRQEVENMAVRRPNTIFHDELSECHPVYFREFAERAGRHGLQYLGEANFHEMQDTAEAPEAAATLRKLARDPIEKEQYLDFVKCRKFRQTLLCRAEVPLDRRVESAQMREFYVTRGHRAEGETSAPTEHSVAVAARAALDEAWPRALAFDELLDATGSPDAEILADIVLAFFACGLFQLHVWRPEFARSAGSRPRASALARYQASRGEQVTNLCHYPVRLEDEMSRRLLLATDGTRDRAALLAEVGEGSAEELERSLEGFAGLALLEVGQAFSLP